jgi:inner membrane protein
LNVYGVHPFHPFDSRWVYGDTVFIVEPVFWIAFGAPLALMAKRRAPRWLLFALLAGAPLLFTWHGFLLWGSLAGLGALGAVLALLEMRPRPRERTALAAGLLAAAGFVAVQGYAAHAAREQVLAGLARRDPADQVLDVPLSAFPSNPLCWAFAAIERNPAAGTYRVSRGVLSLAPAIVPVSACPAATGGAPQAPGTPALAWVWEEQGKVDVLRALRSSSCQVDAWLRFARAPSLAGGEATDVRFGPAGGRNFTTLPYEQLAGTPCPQRVPRWGYPRADLLGLD